MSDTKTDAVIPFQPPPLRRVEPRGFSLMPNSLGEAMELARMIAGSDMAPKDYAGKPANVLIAIQMGADVGLKPMQALQNIAVINGRPSIWGDAALGLVQASGEMERFHETMEGEGQNRVAICIAKRKGFPDEIRRTFSWADAKKADLIGKKGPWTTYESRMMQMRARGWVLRDGFADILVGLNIVEEAMDIPTAIDVTPGHAELPPANLMDRIPEGLRDNMEKAFETLSMSAAQRLAKVNEFLGKEGVSPEEGAEALLDWCKDEYAKRKTGQPRKKVENGKSAASPSVAPPAQGENVTASSPSASGGDTPAREPEVRPPPPAPSNPPAVHEIPWSRGELF